MGGAEVDVVQPLAVDRQHVALGVGDEPLAAVELAGVDDAAVVLVVDVDPAVAAGVVAERLPSPDRRGRRRAGRRWGRGGRGRSSGRGR
jgi:hypothetical protein